MARRWQDFMNRQSMINFSKEWDIGPDFWCHTFKAELISIQAKQYDFLNDHQLHGDFFSPLTEDSLFKGISNSRVKR